jgi:hypothetical protein
MNKDMWDRWAPASGILAVVSLIVGYALIGNSPDTGDSASDVVSYFASHHGRALTATTVIGFGTLFFVWFLASLAATLRKAGEPRLASAAYGAGLTAAGMFLWFGVIYGSLAYSIAGGADEGVAKAVYDLQWPVELLVPIAIGFLVLATSVAGMRSTVLPDWFAWLGVVAAAAFALGSTTWAEGTGFWSPVGAYSMIIFFVFLGWTVVTSALLVMRTAEAELPTAAAQPL